MTGSASDVWAVVADLDVATQERLAAVLETRGEDPRQRAMRHAFLTDLDFPEDVQVLDVGCGTGVTTRILARWPNVGTVTGVDPAPFLLERARELAGDLRNVEFEPADGRSLPFADRSFDAVVFDSTLSHVPGPEKALAEGVRVLRPGGKLAAFDGDYATVTVALREHDPLQVCVDAMIAQSVNDRWIVRRLPTLLRSAGLTLAGYRSHGYVEVGDGGYMLTIIDRGADILRGNGQIAAETAEELKAEARRRVAAGTFFGHIAYGSVIGEKPA
jgi:SAM-dependent methyltransferase